MEVPNDLEEFTVMQSIIHKPTLLSTGDSGAPVQCNWEVGEYFYNLPHHQGKGVYSKEGTGHSIVTG